MPSTDTFVRSNRMRSHHPSLRGWVERILAGDGSVASPARDRRLTPEEQAAALLELLASVDENAYRRGTAEASRPCTRSEIWALQLPDSPEVSLAHIDVLQGELVVIEASFLAALLEASEWKQLGR